VNRPATGRSIPKRSRRIRTIRCDRGRRKGPGDEGTKGRRGRGDEGTEER
jgi:hypothetical protein